MNVIFDLTIWSVCLVGYGAGALRWLRVAQREHYEARQVSRLALLWYRSSRASLLLAVVGAILAGLSIIWSPFAIPSALVFTAIPIGLSIFGRTSPLRRTPRLLRLSGLLALLTALLIVLLPNPATILTISLLLPPLLDLALYAVGPFESLLARRFIARAQAKLAKVNPILVAITGSYGKTSTKAYTQALVSRHATSLASPASFNNLLGVSRSINEGLNPGTQVFIAEMGTYGKGEIRELCRLFPPDIAAITTIGEAHLSRMRTKESIVEAKKEIAERAHTVVLNIDVPELRVLADELDATKTKTVIRCTTNGAECADVDVDSTGNLWVARFKNDGMQTAEAPISGHISNYAVAAGILLAIRNGQPWLQGSTASHMPSISHRAEVHRNPGGVTIIDDTYNANPDGARSALQLANSLADENSRVWVITPGMIELGKNQATRNSEFAVEVQSVANSILVVVGQTNRRALKSISSPTSEARWYRTHGEAVAAVNSEAQPGDIVLYENQLPDHYP